MIIIAFPISCNCGFQIIAYACKIDYNRLMKSALEKENTNESISAEGCN